MSTPNFFFDDGAERKTIEDVAKCFPDGDLATESSLAFVVESVDAIDGCALMVASEKEEIFGVSDLQREQKRNRNRF